MADIDWVELHYDHDDGGELAELLPRHREKRRVELWSLRPPELRALAAELPHFRDLERLKLMYCRDCEDSEAWRLLAEGICARRVSTLAIHCSGGVGGVVMVQALALALEKNKTVNDIDLRENGIGDEGCEALARVVERNKAVTSINLRYNHITDQGCEVLVAALEKNSTVTKVDLDNNKIEDEQLKASLLTALKRNQKAAEERRSRWKERLEERLKAWWKSGLAPLLVVRLCFVGRGYAGKTTTLRCLKGEKVVEGQEASTHGLDVWAGQAQDSVHDWRPCKVSARDQGAWNVLSLESIEAVAVVEDEEAEMAEIAEAEEPPTTQSPPAFAESAAVGRMSIEKKRAKKPQIETRGPKPMDVDLLVGMGDALSPRLQCWDFPGQQEYAICNLLYFNGRGIYLVFCDMSTDLEEAWMDLKFWLWTVAQYGVDERDRPSVGPPVLILATKWGKRHSEFDEEGQRELDRRISQLVKQMPRLEQQLLPGPGTECASEWLFPIENFAKDREKFMKPLRDTLEKTAMELLTSEEAWAEEAQEGDKMPRHVGLQAKQYPVSWLQAHDLLVELAEGVEVTFDVESFEESFEEADGTLRRTVDCIHKEGHTFMAPRGCSVQVLDATEESVQARISCNSLELGQVKKLLAHMLPVGIGRDEAHQVLRLLHSLGIIFWCDEEKLRDSILLNIRKVAVALSSAISLRFWDEKQFRHADDFKKALDLIQSDMMKETRRFRMSGVASRELLQELWKREFQVHEQGRMVELLEHVMLKRGLIFPCGIEEEFTVPSCLPSLYLPEPRLVNSSIRYLDIGGFVSPNIFPKIASELYQKSEKGTSNLHLGPPQLFRNRIELSFEDASVFLSVFPDAPRMPLRVQVHKASGQVEEAELEKILKSIAEAVGVEKGVDVKDLVFTSNDLTPQMLNGHSRHSPEHGFQTDPEEFIRTRPCLNLSCATCDRCRVARLVRERYLDDLSPQLQQVVRLVSLKSQSRPSGGFRFEAVKFPRDVDVEEYLVAEEGSTEEALHVLAEELGLLGQRLEQRNGEPQIFWGGLKAGLDPEKECFLTWSLDEVLQKKKRCGGHEVRLEDALREGHRTWTAKIDVYAKTTLVPNQADEPRFFKVTNVIRFGYRAGGQIHPVTREKDFLEVVESCMDEYCSAHPMSMKFVKRFWERSAYFAERNIEMERNLAILEVLVPIFEHWAAELAQVAEHARTLISMLEREKPLQDAAVEDLINFREQLGHVQQKVHSEDAASSLGTECISNALKRCPNASDDKASIQAQLHQIQEMVDGCVALVVINFLGSLESPVRPGVHEDWAFPSDHPPIAGQVRRCQGKSVEINVASWNVLNQNYLNYIREDMQGLDRSEIVSLSEDERIDRIYSKVMQLLEHGTHPKHLLCLQECWPKLLDFLKKKLLLRGFTLLRTGIEEMNQEAIIYDPVFVELPSFRSLRGADAYPSDPRKAISEALLNVQTDEGKVSLRILTTHLPGAPYGPAMHELCECLKGLKEDTQGTPTLLLGDLNFPDEAVAPLLRHVAELDHVHFLAIPYPTNFCQGSWVPKRIDAIASLSAPEALEVVPLDAEEVLPDLSEVVNLFLEVKRQRPRSTLSSTWRTFPETPGWGSSTGSDQRWARMLKAQQMLRSELRKAEATKSQALSELAEQKAKHRAQLKLTQEAEDRVLALEAELAEAREAREARATGRPEEERWQEWNKAPPMAGAAHNAVKRRSRTLEASLPRDGGVEWAREGRDQALQRATAEAMTQYSALKHVLPR